MNHDSRIPSPFQLMQLFPTEEDAIRHLEKLRWGEIFGDQMLATAILDRLLHHATTLNIKGESSGRKRSAGPGCWGVHW